MVSAILARANGFLNFARYSIGISSMRAYIILAAAMATLSFQANANIIANGSFELGDFNNTDTDPRPEIMRITPGMPNISGWSVVGSKGVHWMDLGPGNTTDGRYALDLQGENPPGEFSSISTDFSTQPGQSYILAFDAFTGNIVKSATVSVGSLINQKFSGGGPAFVPPFTNYFTHYVYGFNATGSTSTLLFHVVNSDGFGPSIDNVVVTSLPDTAVPEPRSYLLLGFGIVALGLSQVERRASGNKPRLIFAGLKKSRLAEKKSVAKR